MQFGYAFDSIGNRTTATINGRQATYTPNPLNQYSAATVPGVFDVLGTASAAATVTVNRQPVTRAGAYYSTTLSVNNSAAPVWQEVKVVGVRKNAGPDAKDVVTESIGHEFVPQTPEAFTYDDDGNMTADGRWAYTWDGENRLVKIEAASGLPNGARKKIEFAYDGQSRRIEKKSYDWSGSTWVLASDHVFVYDGWNLIAELNANDLSLVRKYCWGLDLSGSLQGAGGVGGLLAVTSTTATQFAAYDGNGNVVALIDAATGAAVARYEYDPFGNTLVQTGAAAAGNPFRFSTKYTDSETGLLYYGLRYYTPRLGRWISRDPLGEYGGAAVYSFCSNEPLSILDLLGLAPQGQDDIMLDLRKGDTTDRLATRLGVPFLGTSTFWNEVRTALVHTQTHWGEYYFEYSETEILARQGKTLHNVDADRDLAAWETSLRTSAKREADAKLLRSLEHNTLARTYLSDTLSADQEKTLTKLLHDNATKLDMFVFQAEGDAFQAAFREEWGALDFDPRPRSIGYFHSHPGTGGNMASFGDRNTLGKMVLNHPGAHVWGILAPTTHSRCTEILYFDTRTTHTDSHITVKY